MKKCYDTVYDKGQTQYHNIFSFWNCNVYCGKISTIYSKAPDVVYSNIFVVFQKKMVGYNRVILKAF